MKVEYFYRGGQSMAFNLRFIRREVPYSVPAVLVNRWWASVRLSNHAALWTQVTDLGKGRRLCVVRPKEYR